MCLFMMPCDGLEECIPAMWLGFRIHYESDQDKVIIEDEWALSSWYRSRRLVIFSADYISVCAVVKY